MIREGDVVKDKVTGAEGLVTVCYDEVVAVIFEDNRPGAYWAYTDIEKVKEKE